MPIQLQKISDAEMAQIFARRARTESVMEDYLDALRENNITVGSGLSLKTVNVKSEDGEVYTILDGSIDEDEPAGVTIRAAKRRFNLAARELGFSLDWREVEGWLVMRGVELKAEEPANGKGE